MGVLPQCILRGNLVCSIGEPELWSVFTRFHQASSTTREPSQRSGGTASVSVDERALLLLQHEFPWLTIEQLRAMLRGKSATETGAGSAGQPTGGSSASSGSPASRPVPQDVPEDVCAAVQSQLEALRRELREAECESSFFKVRVLGGDWSVRLFGQSAKDFGAYAKDKAVAAFCQSVGWPERRSYAVRLHGGVLNSRMLAEEVARKGNYFFQCWTDAGSPAPFSFRDLKQAYVSPAEYTEWFELQPVASAQFRAAHEIFELCPLDVPC